MENAAKALSIAASVLIAVLLVALLLFMYHQFVALPRQEEQNAQLEQTAEFNEKYLAYNKQNLKANDLISLFNMAEDNNIKYKDVPEYKITIEVTGNGAFTMEGYTKDKVSIREKIKLKTYRCTNVKYDGPNGRISSMTFEEI